MRNMLKTGLTVFTFVGAIAVTAAQQPFASAAQNAPAAPARSASAPTQTTGATAGRPAIKPATSHDAGSMTPAEQTALVKQYCATCHNDRSKAGQLSLASFDAARLEDNGELTEKM